MTKVLIHPSLLDYCKELADIVSQTIKENFIAGLKTRQREEPSWLPADLLPPPKIERFYLELYEGRAGDLIQSGITIQ